MVEMRNTMAFLLCVLFLFSQWNEVAATIYRTKCPDPELPINVAAHFNMNGIRGTIGFYQDGRGSPVIISVRLTGLNQFDGETWPWHVHDLPINWALLDRNPCGAQSVGGHYDPLNRAANPNYAMLCAADPANCEVGDLSGRSGRLSFNVSEYYFEDRFLDLYGPHTIIGRSIVIHRANNFRYSCANIGYDGHHTLKTYRATFPCNHKQYSPVFQGEIILRHSHCRHGVTIEPRLYRVDGAPLDMMPFTWSLWTGNLNDEDCGDCSGLTHVFGTRTHAGHEPFFARCGSDSFNAQYTCPVGNLTQKCGPLTYARDNLIHSFCTDTQLGAPYSDPGRHPQFHIDKAVKRLSIGIQDPDGTLVACSSIKEVAPITARVKFRNGTCWVDVLFSQNDPHDETYVRYNIGCYNTMTSHLQIRENEVTSPNCENLGTVFEPRFNFQSLPESPLIDQTGDRDFLGELRFKVPIDGRTSSSGQIRSSWLPLFGECTILDRPVVLLDQRERILGCGTIRQSHEFVRPYVSLSGYQ